MEDLKQSTAKSILVGPVLNVDGTLYTTDDLARTDFKLTKSSTVGDLNASATVAHSHQGHFLVGLTTSDTDTLGSLVVSLNKATLAMTPRALMVEPANVWDSLYGSDKLQVDAVEISSDSDAANNLETACDGGTYNVGGGAVVAASVSGSVGSVTSPVTAGTVSDKTGYGLSGGERTTLAAALEAAIINELDGTAVMQAIADLIAGDMTTGDLSVQAIAAACRDAILDRVLAGNHDTASTAGKLLQNLDAAVSSRGTSTLTTTDIDNRLEAYDGPTNTEFEARTLLANQYALEATLTAIKGAMWSCETLKAIKDAVDLKLATEDYTAPDNTGIGTAASAAVSAAASAASADGKATAIQAKTDTIPASPAAVGSAMVVSDKTGFSLAATGLDAITATEPTGKPTTFPGWIMWLVQRFRRVDKTATTIVVKTEAGAIVTTQTTTDDGAGSQTLGAPS